jgi:hypothetical protein
LGIHIIEWDEATDRNAAASLMRHGQTIFASIPLLVTHSIGAWDIPYKHKIDYLAPKLVTALVQHSALIKCECGKIYLYD